MKTTLMIFVCALALMAGCGTNNVASPSGFDDNVMDDTTTDDTTTEDLSATVRARLPSFGGQAFIEEIAAADRDEMDCADDFCESQVNRAGQYKLSVEVERYMCVPFYADVNETQMKSAYVYDGFDWSANARCAAAIEDGTYVDEIHGFTVDVWTEIVEDRYVIFSGSTVSGCTLDGDTFFSDAGRCTVGTVTENRKSFDWSICDKPTGGCGAITDWNAEGCGGGIWTLIE